MSGAVTVQDLTILGLAVIVGVKLALGYDLVRAFRIVITHRPWVVSVEDILYWIVVAVISFGFCLGYQNGEVRLFSLLGHLLGFLAYRYTIGRVLWFIVSPILRAVHWVVQGVVRPFRWIFSKSLEKIEKFVIKWRKNRKKFLKKAGLHLKCKFKIVYNSLIS